MSRIKTCVLVLIGVALLSGPIYSQVYEEFSVLIYNTDDYADTTSGQWVFETGERYELYIYVKDRRKQTLTIFFHIDECCWYAEGQLWYWYVSEDKKEYIIQSTCGEDWFKLIK